MRHLFLCLLTVGLLSCKEGESLSVKTLDFGTFTLTVPGDWQKIDLQGFDSQVGAVTNGISRIEYDYGFYSYDFKNETSTTHIRTNILIDDRPALIVRPKVRGRGIIGAYIQVNNNVRLTLYSNSNQQEETVMSIIRSVKFR